MTQANTRGFRSNELSELIGLVLEHPYQAMLTTHRMACSMSRRGDCWDNAVVESFFHSLKVERVPVRPYASRADAETDMHDYIERFYNRLRRHSTLGYLSPVVYELRHAA